MYKHTMQIPFIYLALCVSLVEEAIGRLMKHSFPPILLS